MDFFTSMKISSSGLTAQRKRMNTVSSNVANAETTRTKGGGPYKRRDVVFKAVDMQGVNSTGSVVDSSEVMVDNSPPQMVYNPNHPDADQYGYVAMPNVNMMEEMVDMLSATRAYEANASVIGASKSMAQRAVELLK